MVNSDYNVLKDWMFGKLTSLLENTLPNPEYPILKMSLGEPTLNIPNFAKNILEDNFNDWGKYPPSIAIPSLGNSIIRYIERRYPYGIDITLGCFFLVQFVALLQFFKK